MTPPDKNLLSNITDSLAYYSYYHPILSTIMKSKLHIRLTFFFFFISKLSTIYPAPHLFFCEHFSAPKNYPQHLFTNFTQVHTLWITYLCIFIHFVDNILKLLSFNIFLDTIIVFYSVNKSFYTKSYPQLLITCG